MISAEEISKLRLETGAGVMDCKDALDKADGDYEKAKKILAGNAQVIAKNKAARIAKHGLIECYSHNGKIGVILELACETDFVARNAEFKQMAHMLAMHIASMAPKTVEELLDQEWVIYYGEKADQPVPGLTVGEWIKTKIMRFKENIQVKRFTRFGLGEE